MQNSVESIEEALQDSSARPTEQVLPSRKPGNQLAGLLGLFILFGITTTARSVRRFWYDELFTFNVSQMHGLSGVWAALKGGVDFNPPLGYMVTKGFQSLFGNTEFPTRMPALLGFFVMSLCLYRFVSTRSTPALGYAAAVFPWCSGAHILASEARPYGLMFGFAGLALLCWQEASCPEGSRRVRRVWYLLGFTLSVAAALLSHCYAVLIFIPFTLAELVRQYRGRQLDRAMWIALLSPLGCVSVYFPLLHNLNGFVSNNYYFKVPWTTLPASYGYLLVPLLWPLAISAFIVSLPVFHAEDKSEEPSVLWHEWTVAAGFAIVPAVGVLLAKGVSAMFFPRYGAFGVIGLSLLFTLYLRWRRTPERAVSIVIAVFLACYVCAFGASMYEAFMGRPNAESASLDGRERRKNPLEVKPELPFVVSNALEFFEIDHYGGPELASRLYYLTDRDAALQYTQTNLFDSGFPVLQRWFPMRGTLAPYEEFVKKHQRFLVYGPYFAASDWVIKKLIDDGANVRLLSDAENGYGDNLLLEVTPKQ